MLQVGIFTGYFPYALDETAKKIRGLGFNTVQLDLHFKDIDFSTPEAITVEKAKRVRETFRDHDLPICCLSGYTNIVHPDPAERKKRLDQLKAIIKNARHFGSPYVISETGTFNAESDWVHHPKNKTEEGFADCREVIRELAQIAYDHGAVFLLETYVNNVVGSVEETVRMFAEVDHPGLGLLMDPTNYFEDHNIDEMDAVLKQIFDTLTDRVRISHAKDVKRAEADKIGEACRHRRRGCPGVAHLPRRRRDRAARTRPRQPELRSLLAASGREAPEHPDHHRASRGVGRATRQEVPGRPAARAGALRRWWRCYGEELTRRRREPVPARCRNLPACG